MLLGGRGGLPAGTGADVLVRAESRLAGLQAQQAEKSAVGTDDSGPPPPGRGHRLMRFGQAGAGRHRAAREASQRRGGDTGNLAAGDVVTFHDGFQVSGRADDQRGMDMIIAEEIPHLTHGGGQRMSYGSPEHRLGNGAQNLIHQSRIRTAVRYLAIAGQAGQDSPVRRWTNSKPNLPLTHRWP